MPRIRPAVPTALAFVAAASLAAAQAPAPYAPPSPFTPLSAYRPPAPSAAYGPGLSQSDAEGLRAALTAAKSGDGSRVRAAMAGLYDPLARKIALWALADAAPESMTYQEAEDARGLLFGWPGAGRRQVAAANRQTVAQADAEFQAGWIALERLKDARGADAHFQRLQALGRSPLTQSRALYWRGRAAEALGDPIAAQGFYAEAARYYTTFYGQLAAAKTGAAVITLGRDPPITPADAARFEAREPVRAARLLAGIGAKDAFKAFVGALSETLPTAQEEALLVDFTRGWGDQEAAMRVVRNAARRGFILPERGYPIRTAPAALGAPEAPFVLGITRQESSFDPRARSGAGARGMMQLMPATAQGVARRLGLSYDPQELDDPDYNMRLGSAFLGDLVGEFSGSYLMAAAAYNAGPGRPVQWSATCGDPRSSSTDPVDFIECIPFSETRDYVMRVLEATQVYRARLAGGSAPITLAADLKRGAYGYAGGYAAPAPARATGAYEPYPSGVSTPGATMAPIPDPVSRR